MLDNYRWISQAAVAAGVGHLGLWDWYSHEAFNGIAGFWFPGMASTFMTMGQMAEEVTLAARANSLPMKQVFVNATLGEVWKPWEEIDKDDLEFRVEDYPADVPRDVVMLTCAGDVQINRVELEVAGWAVSEERWSIDYQVFFGDPTRVEAENEVTVWDQVWDYLEQEWNHELGVKVMVTCGVFDTGGACTDAVYEFTKKAQNPRLWAWRLGRKKRFYWGVKGASTPGVPIAPKKPSVVGREQVPIYLIGTEVAKDSIAAALKTGWSKEGEWVGGAKSYHFPSRYQRDFPDYFAQVTSERAVPSFHRGRPVRRWVPIRTGARNEAWDNLVYNLAAKEISKVNLKQYQRLLNERVARLPDEKAAPVPPQTPGDDGGGEQPAAPPTPVRQSPSGSFRIPRRGGRW
jgi:phage terminase large subunit GpA-like protein